MVGTRLKIASALVVLLGCGLILRSPALTWAATKVPTKTILVPEEKNPEADESPAQPEAPKPAIPDDALPNLEPNVKSTTENQEKTPVDSNPPPVMKDLTALPAPVLRMHSLLLEAAKKGDISELRNLIGIGETATTLSIGGLEGDPINYLKEASGDDDGFEILAILTEVLEAGYVHLDPGTENEMFVWPYFFAWPFDKLTPPMKVELFRILTAGDVQDSSDFGGYIFYRVGIRPNGHWDFFVAGD